MPYRLDTITSAAGGRYADRGRTGQFRAFAWIWQLCAARKPGDLRIRAPYLAGCGRRRAGRCRMAAYQQRACTVVL